MTRAGTEGRLSSLLAPLRVKEFVRRVEASQAFHLPANSDASRLFLPKHPRELLIDGWPGISSKLTWHSAAASGPAPDPRAARSKAEFAECVAGFHDRGYSVRFPDLRDLSPDLDFSARAMEQVLHRPVSVSAFWSKKGLRAPVHFDDHDIIVVQLEGEKDWFIRTEPSALRTNAMAMAEEAPSLGAAPGKVTMRPGDLLYVPRGLAHTVTGEAESIHIAFGFTPFTVRDAIVAAVDLMMENDRSYRETLSASPSDPDLMRDLESRIPDIVSALRRVETALSSAADLRAALDAQCARTVIDMRKPAERPLLPIHANSTLRRREDGVCFIRRGATRLELSFPGGRIFVHPGAEPELRFMASRPEFRIRDLPGGMELDAKLALAAQLMKIGFLELSGATAQERPQPA